MLSKDRAACVQKLTVANCSMAHSVTSLYLLLINNQVCFF